MAKREPDEYPPFIAVTKELLRDPVFRKFSNKTKLLWIYLRREYIGAIDTRIRFGPAMIRDVMKERSYRDSMKELKTAKWIEVDYTVPVNNQGMLYKLKGPHSYFVRNGFKLG